MSAATPIEPTNVRHMATGEYDLGALGTSIRERRERYGINPTDFAALVAEHSQAPFARSTVYSVEAGKTGRVTAMRAQRALEAWETENGYDEEDVTEVPPKSPSLVTFRLKNLAGVDITVEGPVDDMAEIEAAVGRLAERMSLPDRTRE